MNYSTKLIAGTMLVSVLVSGQVSAAQPAASVQLEKDLQLLEQKQADVTGDQTADSIALYGKKMDKTSPYESELFVKVTDGKSKQVISINLNDGGYEPTLSLQDFTADKAAEIMVTADTGGSGAYTTNHIYSVKNGKVQTLSLPALEKDKEGVVGIGFASLKPIALNKGGLYMLEGTERLIGEYNADVRGYLTSHWKWNQNKWELVNAAFEPTPKELPVYENTFTSSDSTYSFQGPKSWMGNVLVNELTGTQADEVMPKAKSVTSFEMNSPDIHDRFAVVAIYAFDKTDWNELNNPDEPPVGSVIMEDAATNTIYAASLPQDSVFDPDTAKGKLFQSLVMSLDDVKKAFALVKR